MLRTSARKLAVLAVLAVGVAGFGASGCGGLFGASRERPVPTEQDAMEAAIEYVALLAADETASVIPHVGLTAAAEPGTDLQGALAIEQGCLDWSVTTANVESPVSPFHWSIEFSDGTRSVTRHLEFGSDWRVTLPANCEE